MIFLWRRRAVTPRLTRAISQSPQRYGSMRSRRPASSARTWFVCRRLRFRLVAFLVRMWLLLAWPHLYLPEAVFRKRLAAARLVLILGIGVVRVRSVTGPGGGRSHAFHPALAGRKPLIPQESRRVRGTANNNPGRNRGRALCRAFRPNTMKSL